MRFARQLSIVSVLLSFLSVGVSAQGLGQNAAFSSIGSLFAGIFSGIFNGISANPAVWFKVILFFILFVILYAVFAGVGLFAQHKNGRMLLSLFIALGAVAAIPNELVVTLFGVLGFFGTLVYIAPVIGIMFWTHKLTADENGQPAGKQHYVLSFLLWLLVWFVYIGGVGTEIGASLKFLSQAQALLTMVAFGYLIYYGFKMAEPRSAPNAAVAIGAAKNAMANIRQAAGTPADADMTRFRNTVGRAIGAVGDVDTAVGMVSSRNPGAIKANQRAIERALVTLAGSIQAIVNDGKLMKHIENLNPAFGPQLRTYQSFCATRATRVDDWDSLTPAHKTELVDDLVKLFKTGQPVLKLLERIQTDLT
jgi:hypothetical protein